MIATVPGRTLLVVSPSASVFLPMLHTCMSMTTLYTVIQIQTSVLFPFSSLQNTCKNWMLLYQVKLYCRYYITFIIKFQARALHLLKTNLSFLLENILLALRILRLVGTVILRGCCDNCTCNKVEM